jgi:Tfp pilus assembly protein PilV
VNRVMRALRRDDSGLTMVEILISVMLTSILLAAAAGMMIQVSKITLNSNQTQNSTRIASNVSNGITNVIRMGTKIAKTGDVQDAAIAAATATSMTIYSNAATDYFNPGPTRVTWTLITSGANMGDLVEDRCVAKSVGGYWTFTTCASAVTRTLGSGLKVPGTVTSGKTAAATFTYLDVNNVAIPYTSLSTDAQRKLVAGITVEITVQAPGSITAPSVIRNTVILRNLGLGTSTTP